MVVITLSMSSLGSTLTATCIGSTSGAGKHHPTSGWKPSVRWSNNGSRASGPRNKGRSKPGWGRSSNGCSASVRHMSTAASFRHAVTRQSVLSQSVGRMALDGLYVPQSAAWLSDLRHELLSFPAGKHDDIVDALGLVGQLLDRISVGSKPKEPEKPKIESGYRRYEPPAKLNDWMTW